MYFCLHYPLHSSPVLLLTHICHVLPKFFGNSTQVLERDSTSDQYVVARRRSIDQQVVAQRRSTWELYWGGAKERCATACHLVILKCALPVSSLSNTRNALIKSSRLSFSPILAVIITMNLQRNTCICVAKLVFGVLLIKIYFAIPAVIYIIDHLQDLILLGLCGTRF